MKKRLGFLLIFVLCSFFIPFISSKAASTFDVYLENGNLNNFKTSFGTYQEAYNYVQAREKENRAYNWSILNGVTVRYATYALVNFNTKGNANTTYTIEHNNKQGYTNGAFGADAAFLGTSADGTKVRFKLSGVIGWVNANEVEVVNINPKNYAARYTSSYQVVNGEFTHNISGNTNAYKITAITLGHEIPKGVANNKFYWSYDGHYFYTESLEGFRAMIRDYKDGVHTNAVNVGSPYYNYYQFLSHRSISNYTSNQIQQDLSYYTSKAVPGTPLQDRQSQLFGEQVTFVQYQGEFGANAMLVYGVAKNESAFGRSNFAINRNNLFGHSAYDSNPGSADYYDTVGIGIYAHTRYFVSQSYTNPSGNNYYGGFLGDKGSGFNVRYASDPYWGEKAAKYYYAFDKVYGYQDFRKYGLGIKEGSGNYPIQASPSKNAATLYYTGTTNNFVVTVLSSVTGDYINGSNVWYKIQSDPTLNSSRTGYVTGQGFYNYDHNVAYIHSSYLTYVQGGKAEKKRYTINFNPNGGTFDDYTATTKSLSVEEYVIPDIKAPSKKDSVFLGWDKTVEAATENTTYTAVYRSNTSYQITFDANGGEYPDGTTSKVVYIGANEKPIFNMEPSKDGYVFIGWDKQVVAATGNTIYKAQYQNVLENDKLVEKDSFFYLDHISSKNGKLYIKGFQTIEGINNNLNTGIHYMVMFVNVDNEDEVYTASARRLKDSKEIPYPSYGMGNYDYSYAWFEFETDFDGIENGNYVATVVAYTNHEFSVSILSNKMFAPQATSYSGKKEVMIRNNYYNEEQPVEFVVRDRKLADRTTSTYTFNQFDQFFELDFNDKNLLHIKGYTYSYGMNLASTVKVSRKIIFENQETYETISIPINAIKGDYDPVLPESDSLSKSLAWYDGNLDLSNLKKGTYRIYLATTSNISDYSELTDLFNQDLTGKTKTINGKTYQFQIVSERGNVLELVIS